jgi:hypothetical protein
MVSPKLNGIAANRALQQLEAALGYAYRMEWIHRNPASAKFVSRFEERRCEDFLDADGYAAVGQILRDFEGRLARGRYSRIFLRTLYALRLAIYTGARQRSELLWTRLDWCHLDCDVLGLESRGRREIVLRAVGGGRWAVDLSWTGGRSADQGYRPPRRFRAFDRAWQRSREAVLQSQ